MRTGLSAVLLACWFAVACSRPPAERAAKYMENAKKRAQAKDHPGAILQFRNAAKYTPDDPELYYQMALSYTAVGDPAAAIAGFQKAVQLQPKHAGAQLKLAELAIASAQKDLVKGAAERLTGVLAQSPRNVDALQMRASAQVSLGALDEAESDLKLALAESPGHVKSILTLAVVKISRGDFEAAERLLKEASARYPESVGVAAALGKYYVLKGKAAEAEAQFQHALKIDANHAPALLDLGAIQVRGGQKEAAAETYKRLASLPDPQYKLVHATFLSQTGQKDAALSELERLYRENPKDRNARSGLVKAYLEAKRVSDAEKLLAEALDKNPRDVEALLQRSALHLERGKHTEAESDLDLVLRYRPESAEARYLLARIHGRRGASANQKRELSEALRLNPQMLPARLDLAQALLDSKSAKAALELLDAAPESQRRGPVFLALRNWALIALNQTAEARAGVDAGLAQSRTPELLLQDGLLRFRRQDHKGGRESLEEALKGAPEDIRALDALIGSFLAEKQGVRALSRLREQAAARTGSAPVQHYFGKYLMQIGDKEGARKAFLAAKTADARFVAADLDLARLDIAQGKKESARQILTALVAADSRNATAGLMLGMLEETMGNSAKAIEHYRKVLEVDDRNVLALNNLAFQLAEFSNQLDEALKYAQKARELAPDSLAAVDDTLGWIHYRKGIYRTAVRYLESALAKEPTPRRKYHLAMAYLKAGEEKTARRTLEAALKMDPALPEAKLAQDVFRESAP